MREEKKTPICLAIFFSSSVRDEELELYLFSEKNKLKFIHMFNNDLFEF
jgi:hypothetical protein